MPSPSNVRTPPVHGRGTSQGGIKPRVVSSSRAYNASTSRHERVASKENVPLGSDMVPGLKTSTRERDSRAPSELRTERSHTTTREKVQVRTKRPTRETASSANRDWDRSRTKTNAGSPVAKAKEKELNEGWPSLLSNSPGYHAHPNNSYSPMDPEGIPHTSLGGASILPCLRSTPFLNSSSKATSKTIEGT
ncbi:hypothetical protein CIHG_01936 [Coccidioides immitis H538.4]|uniref:Uncharacterized protein n=1 Tax=Coccidioides immitis H538.4 TaxID=396776 RepID=A0A0J8RG65_COCIT|nr:hypothetical protein CIHG_01936 [Coccidioides immitis H538.4]